MIEDAPYYIVLRVQSWDSITYGEDGPPIGVEQVGGDPIGFLPVFDSYADAVDYAGSSKDVFAARPSE